MEIFRWPPYVKDEETNRYGYIWRLRFKDISKPLAGDILKFLRKNDFFYFPSWKGEFWLEKEYCIGDAKLVVADDRTYIINFKSAISYRLYAFVHDSGSRRKLLHISQNGAHSVFEVLRNDCNILDVNWLAGDKADYRQGVAVNFCHTAKLLGEIQDIGISEFTNILRTGGLRLGEHDMFSL